MFRVTIVFVALIGVTLAAVALVPQAAKPDKFKGQEGCYIPELDRLLALGAAAASSSGCLEHRCGEKYVQLVSCGAVAPQNDCTVITDKSKSYPDCCPKYRC